MDIVSSDSLNENEARAPLTLTERVTERLGFFGDYFTDRVMVNEPSADRLGVKA